MRLRGKFFISALILILLAALATVYLNQVLLPKKIKALIIQGIEDQIQKKVSLKELKFSIFKGIVLKDLYIYDDKETILTVKEASCTFLPQPIFKKKIIIPTIWIKGPVMNLERRQDGSFNIKDLFSKSASAQTSKNNWSIAVYWIKISNGKINFRDNSINPRFTKNLENIDANISLSLPAAVRFSLKSHLSAEKPMSVSCVGEYRFPQEEAEARISIEELSPKEFAPYYEFLNLSVPEGLLNVAINLKGSRALIYGQLEAQSRNTNIIKDKISLLLNSAFKADFQYVPMDKTLAFSGRASVKDSKISGAEFIDQIDNIDGELNFSNAGIFSDKLNLVIWGTPAQASFSLTNFSDPLLNASLFSRPALENLQQILKERFKFNPPLKVGGQCSLTLSLQTKVPLSGALQLVGYADVMGGSLVVKNNPYPLKDIHGRLEFNANQLRWKGLNFTYQNKPYKSDCTVTNFQSPGVQFALSSKELTLNSSFAVNKNLVNLTKCDGQYYNSVFSFSGDIDISDFANPDASLSGLMEIDLEELKERLSKYKEKLVKINPQGLLHGQFTINGNISDLDSCSIEARLAGDEISLFGLKGKNLFLNYSQEQGIVDIPLAQAELYDGSISAGAKINLNKEDLPYWVNLEIKNVKIDKLKVDTAVKDKNISGILNMQTRIDGLYYKPEEISGSGKIFVTDGKFWNLDLFTGLGALVFTRENFHNIVFKEGQCDFIIKDKFISTDNLFLNSDVVNLAGPVKIGFDSSIAASLDVQVLDDKVPLTGTFRDVTTAIMGKAGRFGVIKVSGTLKNPEYKFKTAVGDIMKGITNTIFGK